MAPLFLFFLLSLFVKSSAKTFRRYSLRSYRLHPMLNPISPSKLEGVAEGRGRVYFILRPMLYPKGLNDFNRRYRSYKSYTIRITLRSLSSPIHLSR